jgi:hypothetical protein
MMASPDSELHLCGRHALQDLTMERLNPNWRKAGEEGPRSAEKQSFGGT